MINYLTVVTGNIYQENCYIIFDDKDSIIIDPGDDFDLIDNAITQNKLVPSAVLLTHGHFDHVGAVKSLKEKYNIKVYMNSDDLELLSFMRTKDFDIDVDIKNLEEIFVGNIKIKCIKTPGHSKGSVCYIIDDFLFSGDTLFAGSIGRCDLPGGSPVALLNTLSTIVVKLDDKFIVLPGHGEKSTIAEEKSRNLYLKNL